MSMIDDAASNIWRTLDAGHMGEKLRAAFESAWENGQVADLVAEEDQLRAHEDEVGLRTKIARNPLQKPFISADTPVFTRHFWAIWAILGDFGRHNPFSTTVSGQRVVSYTRNQ